MLTLKALIFRLGGDRRAVTALEYALIAGLIALVIVGSVTALGSSVKSVFEKASSGLSSA
nr:Flp family type IVb pilin [uncultured Lichenicoccus sp.]